MNSKDALAKADRIAARLIEDHQMEADFAEGVALYSVASGEKNLRRARMGAFLAGPNGPERFRQQIMDAHTGKPEGAQ